MKETERARGAHELSREGQVKTPKETEGARATHILSSAEERTSQERKKQSEGHSPPVERRVQDKSGHRKKTGERGAHTDCQAQKERQVRFTERD
jgi:hypothetical protein